MHLSSIEDYIRDAALGSGFSRVRFLSPYEPERIFGLKMERDNHWEGAPSLMVVALPYGNRGIAAPENQQQAQPGIQPEAQPIAQSKTEPEARSDRSAAGHRSVIGGSDGNQRRPGADDAVRSSGRAGRRGQDRGLRLRSRGGRCPGRSA